MQLQLFFGTIDLTINIVSTNYHNASTISVLDSDYMYHAELSCCALQCEYISNVHAVKQSLWMIF